MKKVILAVAIFATLGLTNVFGQNEMTKMQNSTISMTSFGVRGNCGMCKKTIEKAAYSVVGVSKADWDKDKKMIMVSFDNSKTNEMAVQKAIASSGYDTAKVSSRCKKTRLVPSHHRNNDCHRRYFSWPSSTSLVRRKTSGRSRTTFCRLFNS